MSLQDRINQLRKDREHLEDVLKEAREELWERAYIARNDERREGESDEHWHKRRRRNRERYENRDEVVEHMAKKLHAIQREIDDLVEHRQEFKEEQRDSKSSNYDKGSTRIVTFDGKSLVEDLAYWLERARKDGGWNGYLVSGYRTPEYSEQLCYQICGAPSCPGRCAGRSSNHTKTSYPGPAADVSDYVNCERALAKVGAPYFNNLPYDLVHMSRSGG
jgi:hypothetical protein